VILFVFIAQDKPSSTIIINNSGHELRIDIGGVSSPLPFGETIELHYPHNIDPVFVHTGEGTIWEYRLLPLDIPIYRRQHRIYVQVETDGRMYVLPFKSLNPVKKFPSQPNGYPLVPKEIKEKIP